MKTFHKIMIYVRLVFRNQIIDESKLFGCLSRFETDTALCMNALSRSHCTAGTLLPFCSRHASHKLKNALNN